MSWCKVVPKEEIPSSEPIAFEVRGKQIAIYLVDDEVYATDNICTHAYSCLNEGYLEGYTIECVLHQGKFDIRNGAPLSGPVMTPLATFSTKVEGGIVFIDVPDE